jgi:hypothetical protein
MILTNEFYYRFKRIWAKGKRFDGKIWYLDRLLMNIMGKNRDHDRGE